MMYILDLLLLVISICFIGMGCIVSYGSLMFALKIIKGMMGG
jgi:hypothetical protein